MNCKACRLEIETRERAEPLSRGAGEHIEACALCRTFRDERVILSQMIGNLEVVSAPADFDFRLRARLAAVRSEGHRGFSWQRFAPGARSLALAASLVVMIAAGLFIRQALRAPSPSTTSVVPINTTIGSTPSPVSVLPPTRDDLQQESNPSSVGDRGRGQTVAYRIGNRKRTTGVMSEPRITNSVISDDGVRSVDSGVTPPPPSKTPPGIPDPITQPGAMIGLPVPASTKSAIVNLDGGRAKPQFISLRPVTFGAQDVIEEKGAQKHLLLRAQGIW